MAMPIQTYNTKVDRIIQDDAGILSSTEIDDFILESLSYYSKDAPYLKVADIAGDGGYQYDLPNDWQEGFSYIVKVEYPAGKQVPLLLEPGDYTVYKTPTGLKLHFYSLSPLATETIRITYTTLYTQSTIDSIPAQDQDAFCLLAAALCCGAIARRYAQTSDSTIDADSVNYRSKSDEYARRAKELGLRYSNFMGKKEGTPSAASGTKDWDTDYSWGGDFLTHPRRGR
jgi:hypothetical protein